MCIHYFNGRNLVLRSNVLKLSSTLGVAIATSCLLFDAALADEAVKTKTTTTTTTTVTNTTNWGGLGWGIGIATNFDMTGGRVGNAAIVNNIVRVTDTSNNVGISFVLEAHYFLRDYRFGFGKSGICDPQDPLNCTELAHGPFVAIEVGDGTTATPAANGPITAYAMGWMVGMRHSPTSTASWNFGLGLRVTPKSQVLGDGVFANQALPPGETAIRYKTEPRYGLMLMSSFSF
jgi:hypothetical protein